MLVPRRPHARFEDDGPTGAALLHDALLRLRRRLGASPPLNLWIRTAPRGADSFCWRIDILPRLTHLAGLELGTGVNLCVVAPEVAAQELRDVLTDKRRISAAPPRADGGVWTNGLVSTRRAGRGSRESRSARLGC